jgi:hypothetical protein
MSFTRARRVTVVLVALSLASGCSLLSESSTSPSESVTGTGRAIGGSFHALSTSTSASQNLSIEARRSGYVRDLRAYVAGFVRSGAGSAQDFQRGVSRVAEGHGIAHWEAEPATPYAIGQGLREADVVESELRALVDQAGADSPAAKLALEGWRDSGS